MIEPSLPIYDDLHDQIEQDLEDLLNASHRQLIHSCPAGFCLRTMFV